MVNSNNQIISFHEKFRAAYRGNEISCDPDSVGSQSAFEKVELPQPVEVESVPFSSPDQAATRLEGKERLRVLVAEDNPTNQRIVLLYLKKFNCEVDVASNGREALELVRQSRYDCILMDCHMPEMDGYEATAAIRESNSAISNVFISALTANAMKGDREKCLAAGMNDYISKPLKIEELGRVLERSRNFSAE
ncbi:MAG: response regulator [Verrucomicrobiota bacterium]|nr:response regulator [Verrucomicrobiota bacterium]